MEQIYLVQNSIYWFILVESIMALSIGLLWGTYEWAKNQTKEKFIVFLPSWAVKETELSAKGYPARKIIFFLIILTLLTTAGAFSLLWITYYYFWPPLRELPWMIIPLSILPVEIILYYFFLVRIINLIKNNKSEGSNL